MLSQLNLSENTNYIFEDSKDDSLRNAEVSSGRLLEMAKQYKNESSKYFNNQEYLDKVISALTKYNKKIWAKGKSKYDNWFSTDITIPKNISQIIIILNDEINNELKETVKNNFLHYVPNISETLLSYGKVLKQEPANIIAQANILYLIGQSLNDEDLMTIAQKEIKNTIQYSSGNGFHKDGSFIAHHGVLSNAAYGREYLKSLEEYTLIKSDFSNEEVEILKNYIHNGLLPIINKGKLFGAFEGRGVSRAYNESSTISILSSSIIIINDKINNNIDTEYLLSSLSDTQINNLSPRAKEIIKKNNLSPKILDRKSFNMYSAKQNIIRFSNGNAVHFNIFSNKIYNTEMFPIENLKGQYLNNGSVNFVNSDIDSLLGNYKPTINPYKIPGTTVSKTSVQPNLIQYKLKSDFSETLTVSKNETTAVSAMTYNDNIGEVEGNKSYVVLGDKIVVIGSNLSNKKQNDFYTTIENKQLTKGNVEYWDKTSKSIFIKGKDDINNIGYKILDNENTLEVNQETSSGSWYELNNSFDKKEILYSNYLNVFVNHKKDSKNSFAYVMSHGITKNQFDLDNSIKLKEISDNVHYLTDGKTQVVILFDNLNYAIENGMTFTQKGIYIITDKKVIYKTLDSAQNKLEKNNSTKFSYENEIIRDDNSIEIDYKLKKTQTELSNKRIIEYVWEESEKEITKYLIISNNKKEIIRKHKLMSIPKK